MPYGCDLDPDGKTLVPNEAEQRIIDDIQEMRAGGMTLQQIAAELTTRGVPTKKGRTTWSHQSVASILRRLSG